MFENEIFSEILTILNNGGIILYPTDTIWGIGCDATNEDAVEKIYQIKDRAHNKGFIILVDSLKMLRQYVEYIHPRIDTLLNYHTRPLTVVYEKGVNLAPGVLSKNGTVAVRIVQDPFCKELIAHFGKPLVSTSANMSGSPFPTHFGEISSDVLEKIDFVVRYRQDDREFSPPSPIIRLDENEELEFLRD